MTIKAVIIGATGYTGQELLRYLTHHPDVEIIGLTSQTYAGQPYSQPYPHFRNITSLSCREEDIELLAQDADVLFMALPHGHAARKLDAGILQQTRIIDLGADFRLKDPNTYETWYGLAHPNPGLLPQAAYGLVEWNRDAIRQARLIANPGCYPTCAMLALLPLLREKIIAPEIIIDAKSGVTGAGRSLNLAIHFTECNESIKAYSIGTHRHTPEIEQGLSLFGQMNKPISFTPHLVPMNRGILVTAYGFLEDNYAAEDILAAYKQYYQAEPFIRLLPADVYPETRWVKGSNYCDIGFYVDPRTRRVILTSAIDNLGKGAAGQAIQNMNLLFGLTETTGLMAVPLFPG